MSGSVLKEVRGVSLNSKDRPCPDCGKLIQNRNVRCFKCAMAQRHGQVSPFKGKRHTEESKVKMRKPKHTIESREKIRVAHRGNGEKLVKGRVHIYSPDNPMSRSNDGYTSRSRLTMSETLGRPLEPEEIVHHVDGDTTNDKPNNLRLYATQSDHISTTIDRDELGRFTKGA